MYQAFAEGLEIAEIKPYLLSLDCEIFNGHPEQSLITVQWGWRVILMHNVLQVVMLGSLRVMCPVIRTQLKMVAAWPTVNSNSRVSSKGKGVQWGEA